MKKRITFLNRAAGDLPLRLKDFIEILEGKLRDVPEEFREDAQIELESDSNVRCRLDYWRPMSPEEEAEAKEREAMVVLAAEVRDRLAYQKLKERFEGPGGI